MARSTTHGCGRTLGVFTVLQGDADAAYVAARALHERIEAQPEGAQFSPGSYGHFYSLLMTGRSLNDLGQPAAAEDPLRRALEIVEALIAQEPTDQLLIRNRSGTLAALGDVLAGQGKYP